MPRQARPVRVAASGTSLRTIALGAALFAALLLPAFVSVRSDCELAVHRPGVHGGDEPHYLIALNSVAWDGDLDLARDYASVHGGSARAGERFRGAALDHHTIWWDEGRMRRWSAYFEIDPARWERDATGNPHPTLRHPGLVAPPDREIGFHPPGHALLLAPWIRLATDQAGTEAWAICLSAAATLLMALSWRSLVSSLADARAVDLATFFLVLATPLWTYARSLFAEPLLTFLVIAAVACARHERPLSSGACLAAATWVKPPTVSFVLPCLILLSGRANRRWLARLALPLMMGVAAWLLFNHLVYGGVMRSSIAWAWGNPGEGVIGLVVGLDRGLLLHAPIVLVALLGVPYAWRRDRRLVLAAAAGAVAWLLLVASWRDWRGGFGFGPRLLLPAVPLLLVGLPAWLVTLERRGRLLRLATWSLAALSVAVNAAAAFSDSFDAPAWPLPC